MRPLANRLKASWYGPAAGLVVLVAIVSVPLIHDCAAISSVRGEAGGVFCAQVTPFVGSTPAAVALAALAAVLVVALPLLSSNPRWLVAAGVFSAAAWLVVIFFLLPSYQVGFWMSSHGLEVRSNELGSEMLFLLPSALLPLAAGLRRHGRTLSR